VSFTSLLTHRLAVERPASDPEDLDDYGQPAREFAFLRETRGLVQPKTFREALKEADLISHAGVDIGEFTIFLPVQDITTMDRLYYLDPADWSLAGYFGASEDTRLEILAIRNAAGRNHHLEVEANVVTAPPVEVIAS
jgi:hypothetical protein